MNRTTFSFCLRGPTRSDRPANNLDKGEEESAVIDLPSSSPDRVSSVLMAHKDVAPNTKGESPRRSRLD